MQHLRFSIKIVKSIALFSILSSLLISACRDADYLAPNNPPVAQAGEDQNAAVSDTVVLNGINSTDPDDDTLAYSWEFNKLPVNSDAVISDQYQRKASFIPDTLGAYIVLLKVSDGIAEDLDTITVTVSLSNYPPIAEAGPDQVVDVDQQVQLNGSNSKDPENAPLSFNWTIIDQPAGSAPALNNPLNEKSTFVPDAPGSYAIRLEVSDGTLSDADTVIISTGDPRITTISPTEGPYQTIVEISGANFSDQVGDIVVRFNGMEATVTIASYKSVNAVVPEGAGTGEVTLTVRGKTATGPVFTYIPTITVSTFAGDGTAGFVNANGTNAQFDQPADLTIDGNDNIFVADRNNHTIRKITPSGDVTTFAGNGQPGFNDATGQQAQFNEPIGIDINDNDSLYIADLGNQRIRIVDPSQSVTSLTVFNSNNQLEPVLFSYPIDVAIDDSNDKLYVSEIPGSQDGNNRILAYENNDTTLLAGVSKAGFSDGTGINASFNYPAGIFLDNNGDLLVADALNHSIRKATSSGTVTTLGGDGTAGLVNGTFSSARFDTPFDLIQMDDGTILIADANNHVIRMVDNNEVTTLAGDGTQGYVDGDGASAQFNTPYGIAVDSKGDIYVADTFNHVIRKITIK